MNVKPHPYDSRFGISVQDLGKGQSGKLNQLRKQIAVTGKTTLW